jgi:hypothetical protein
VIVCGVFVDFNWAKELWYVTEKNSIVRQHFLFNVSIMEPIEDSKLVGLAIHIGFLMITIAWHKKEEI